LTASFLAGSPSFAAAGPQDSRDTLALGLGLRVASGTDGQSGLAVSYDAAVRDSFIAHSGSVRARIGF
ncbi:hypothetical protein ACI4AF_29470, partial [Klebsiella pneumoniae]|uniref:hypothetical protein n=1 Tax=Klebsiella pneumoniae TaxID=573 RepID=UPI0038519FA7